MSGNGSAKKAATSAGAGGNLSDGNIGLAFDRLRHGLQSLYLRTLDDLIVLGALPSWPYSSGWGYYPSSGLGLILVIVVVLVLLGRL